MAPRKHHKYIPVMEGFDVEKEIKQAAESLNAETIKQMDKCLQELTTSGSPSLDGAVTKNFKRFCRQSDGYVRYAFLLIMRQLKKQHSEIRLSAFQMADELFNRSHAFREVLVIHLQPFLALTTETELNRPLPPPKAAANKLKTDTLHALQQWYDKYGQGYRKLAIGYEYLKNCRHVDFNDIRAQNLAERQRIENEEKRKQKIMADRLKKVLKEIAEIKPEIENCAMEAESCLQLLLPTPTDFLLSVPESPCPVASDNGSESIKRTSKSQQGDNENTANSKPSKSEKDEGADSAVLSSIPSFETVSTSAIHSNDMEVDSRSAPSSGSGNGKIDNKSYTKQAKIGDSHGGKDNSTCASQSHAGDPASTFASDVSKETVLETSEYQNGMGSSSESQTVEEKCSDPDQTAKNDGNSENIDDESDMEYDSEADSVDDLQAHGLTHPVHSLTLDLPAPGPVEVQVTTDNTDVVRSLKDASKLINSNYLPKVVKWLEILGKNGGKESDIKTSIDLKVHLENIKMKCVDLKLVTEETEAKDKDQVESDDDEFEEVPEKEGYEPRIPNDLRAEYGLAGPSTQPLEKLKSSHVDKESSIPSSGSSCDIGKGKVPSSGQEWSLKERIKSEDTSDPTSLAAALARVKPESLESGPKRRLSASLPSSGTSTSSNAEGQENTCVPVVEFGSDLAYWENPDEMEAPSIVKFDSLHRFWTPKEVETEKPSQHDLAAARNRAFTYTGKFEPVKWKCRAPMPNGKLCERMDRVKCPFHGKIIARDEQGNPAEKEQPSTSGQATVKPEDNTEAEAQDGELPPWQDPVLQKEIEEATGLDLGSARSQKLLEKEARKKGKGKGKSGKKSNLTDLKAMKNTTKKRLEDKIFNKRSMKRVCANLDRADYKRVRDKFGNQFNYSLK